MPANLAAFALHVDDVDRARGFYEAVFGWEFEPWGPPGFYLIHTGDADAPGVQGLMHQRQVPRSGEGLNGIEPTFAVDDVDARVKKATAAGAKLVMPIFDVPNVGRIAMLLEPSGAGIGWMTPVA